MNAAKFRDILEENLFQSALDLRLGCRFTFQQDNDPKHKAKIKKKWLRNNSVTILDWLSQSPDLNPNQHLWRHLKMAVHQRSPSNLTELQRILKSRTRFTTTTPETVFVKVFCSLTGVLVCLSSNPTCSSPGEFSWSQLGPNHHISAENDPPPTQYLLCGGPVGVLTIEEQDRNRWTTVYKIPFMRYTVMSCISVTDGYLHTQGTHYDYIQVCASVCVYVGPFSLLQGPQEELIAPPGFLGSILGSPARLEAFPRASPESSE
ncbi:hypothetical protein NFI96_020702, partial [Prochilodus magdalenae]